MNECARLHVAVGIDVAVAASAGNAAADRVAVVPEVHRKEGLGLAELVDLLIHELALLRSGDQLRHGCRADGHIGEQPCEFCTHIDHGIEIFLAADDLDILAGVAAGNAKEQLALFQARHGLDDLAIGALATAEVGRFLKTLDADGGDEVLHAQHFVGKGIVDQRAVGEGEEGAVVVLFTQANQIGLAYQRLTAGVDINVGSQLFALADDAVQLFIAEVQFVAVFRRPAAGAAEIAGRGRIHQDRPGDVALVLILHFHGGGRADQRAVDDNGLHQFFALFVVNVCPQALHQLRPVVVRVRKRGTDSFNLRGDGLTVFVIFFQHIEQVGKIGFRILVQIAVDLLHGKAL